MVHWENIAIIIEALRKEPKKWNELVNLGVSEKSLHRILTEYLGPDGVCLVKQDEYKNWIWCGYEYPKQYTREEYERKIAHTRDLIPGLKHLLDYGFIFEQDLPHFCGVPIHTKAVEKTARILAECAESHLKEKYPTIYEKLERYRKLNDRYKATDRKTKNTLNLLKGKVVPLYICSDSGEQTNQYAGMARITEDITGNEKDELLHISEKEAEYLAYSDPINEISKLDIAERMEKIKSKVTNVIKNEQNLFPTQGYTVNTQPLEDLLHLVVSMEEVYGELGKEMNKLIIRCQHEPLDGTCDICRNFCIIKNEP